MTAQTARTARTPKRSEISMQLRVDFAIEKQNAKQIHLNEYFLYKNKSDVNPIMIGYSNSSLWTDNELLTKCKQAWNLLFIDERNGVNIRQNLYFYNFTQNFIIA